MEEREGASFRDPSGHVFTKNNEIFRQVNLRYKDDFDLLISSGLYEELASRELLVRHEEVDTEVKPCRECYKIIKPEKIPFISYPYEWSFSQLKDAALLTLDIAKRALDRDMVLKDASSYNIQFRGSAPVFIDTLSFEKYREGEPWIGYGQFCRHFLAPLALMAYKDPRLNKLLSAHIDGIPLDLAASILPKRTVLKFSLLSHIHLHAKSQAHYAGKKMGREKIKGKISRFGLRGILNSLEGAINSLKWKPSGTEWAEYYEDTNYSEKAMREKKNIIDAFLAQVETETKMAWDMGANTGFFSRIASSRSIYTVSYDIDYSAVEKNYAEARAKNEKNILPLLCDLTNPAPSIGWGGAERKSMLERGPADTVFALALIHHLAISNNVPFENISDFFHSICSNLIIEFVPKDDSQVRRLLASREDIFDNYTKDDFEAAFSRCFHIVDSKEIPGSKRIIYFMKKGT